MNTQIISATPDLVTILKTRIESAGKVSRIRNRSSETTRVKAIYKNEKLEIYLDWLAGFIDGDGCFCISKKNYPSLEITVHLKEVQVLYKIQTLLGGYINHRKNVNAVRYRLHSIHGIRNALYFLEGRLQHPVRIAQFERVKAILNIKKSQSIDLISFSSAWLTGFIDAEGSFNCNQKTFQLSFSIGQKDEGILMSIQKGFKIGYVYKDRDTFK